MKRIRQALLRIASEDASLRATLLPLTRQADKWKSLPKGWTQDSVESFWSNLTGDNKHKVTKCISQMDGKVDDPGAFCASLADKVMGPEWRSKKKAYSYQKVSVAALPASVKKALALTRLPTKRTIEVRIDSSYSMYAAGDDGAKGFVFLVNLDSGQVQEFWGAFGGGGLGTKLSPVDDVNNAGRKIPLPDHLVVLHGQIGGRTPYVGATANEAGFARLTAPRPRVGMRVRRAFALGDYLGSHTKLVDMVLKEIKAEMQRKSWSKDPKPLATGFIWSLFDSFSGQGTLAKALWGLFERTGVSLDPSWATRLAWQVRGRVGTDPQGLLTAAAISLSLLNRTRQPRLAGWVEGLFQKHLAQEMEKAGPPGVAVPLKTPSELFEEDVAGATDTGQGVIRLIGMDPDVLMDFAFRLAEDINWHSLEGVGPRPVPDSVYEALPISEASHSIDYDLTSAAALIVFLLRTAGLKRAAEMVKKQALKEFPDAYVDLGPVAP